MLLGSSVIVTKAGDWRDNARRKLYSDIWVAGDFACIARPLAKEPFAILQIAEFSLAKVKTFAAFVVEARPNAREYLLRCFSTGFATL